VMGLIIHHLQSEGLYSAASKVSRDSGVKVASYVDKQALMLNVIEGEWSKVLSTIANIPIPVSTLRQLLEHVTIEMASSNDLASALAVTRSPVLAQMRQDDSAAYDALMLKLKHASGEQDREAEREGERTSGLKLSRGERDDNRKLVRQRQRQILRDLVKARKGLAEILGAAIPPESQVRPFLPYTPCADMSIVEEGQGEEGESGEKPISLLLFHLAMSLRHQRAIGLSAKPTLTFPIDTDPAKRAGKRERDTDPDVAQARKRNAAINNFPGQLVRSIKYSSTTSPICSCFSSDSLLLAVATTQGDIRVYDARTGHLQHRDMPYQYTDPPTFLSITDRPVSIAFSPDARYLVYH
ncbi:hypothetical protein KIPB_007329, partial [Kipferlia bialata]